MHIVEDEHYRTIDLPFYQEHISPIVPERLLDFHTHIWSSEHFKDAPDDAAGAKYMVLERDHSYQALIESGKLLFPDKKFDAVCFGQPSLNVDLAKTNAHAADAGKENGLFPLLITGNALHTPQEIRQQLNASQFYGYKVLINWTGDDYRDVTVENMLGTNEMKIANEMKLVTLLHVPGSRRLADKKVQEGVRWLSRDYPEAQIVLAHCGRCYLPDEMQEAIGSIVDLHNVYLDTAMVMDPTVIQIALEHIGPERVIFATDLPVAAMRGRRVYTMDHWVDLVHEGYPESAYRVASNNMRTTYMVYEIVLAIQRAALRAKISKKELWGIFCDNGMKLLNSVRLAP